MVKIADDKKSLGCLYNFLNDAFSTVKTSLFKNRSMIGQIIKALSIEAREDHGQSLIKT